MSGAAGSIVLLLLTDGGRVGDGETATVGLSGKG